ncbi:unnamed protein product [Ranitomeya imitator]|uniref:Uncharacterized protein n=1 Tax=Ranitomeya imitator TaxID=111125 RepID=A0ABN9KZ99_9NEOB|nr:unnamed protein product [Ranitomeya imitator]
MSQIMSGFRKEKEKAEKLIAYQREFHALKERLRIAEHRTLQRSSELHAILDEFRRAVVEANGSRDALSHFSETLQFRTVIYSTILRTNKQMKLRNC